MLDFTIIQLWLEQNVMNILIKLSMVAVIWIIARIFTKKFDKIIVKNFWPLFKKLGVTRRRFNLVDDIADMCVYIIAITLTLYVLELTSIIYTALTAAGVIGIVIGFAVKEIASNMISGILIKLNQPFIEGDSISIDEKYKGTVTRVSLYYTSIVDYEGVVTNLPNSLVISKPLSNYSHQKERLINFSITVSKDADIDKALEILKEIANSMECALIDRGIDAFVNDIKEYMVVLTLRFWVGAEDFSKAKKEVIKSVATLFKKNKIELAIPMRKNV
ncbi:MAG: mechanosensitive ion channel family protein [Nanoarchaeota archaeon]|nr:mechanosensitive ion channel family protein [Nanoarchaeota archaeon]